MSMKAYTNVSLSLLIVDMHIRVARHGSPYTYEHKARVWNRKRKDALRIFGGIITSGSNYGVVEYLLYISAEENQILYAEFWLNTHLLDKLFPCRIASLVAKFNGV